MPLYSCKLIYLLLQSFKDAKVESRDGAKIVNELAKEMENMMNHKIAAVKVRI